MKGVTQLLNIIAIVKDVDSKEENKKMTMKTP
jgi:hypothetical protein